MIAIMENESLFDTEMETSEERIEEIKKVLKKQHGREFTLEEAKKAVWDLQTIARIAIEMATEEQRRQKMLAEFPKGFHLDCKGHCLICKDVVSNEDSWYDKFGLKCMTCQNAINKRIIPGYVAKTKESWYSKLELEIYFNLKGAVLNKYIKQGFLKDRIIPGVEKKVHLQLFLIKDNKHVLPPKKLLHSRTVKVERNGEEYYTSKYWYEFLDIALAKKLAKYKIMECLKETLAQPIQTGRFYYKEINPLFTHKY
jgi:predicted secreted protein